jgi:glycine oxidase
LALSPADETALKAEIKRQNMLGLRCHWMDNNQLQEELPQLNESLIGGAFFAEDGQVNGEKFLRGLMNSAIAKGATVIQDCGAVSLLKEGNRVSGVKTANEHYQSDQVVVASGAWSDEVLAPLGLKLGVEPIKGQLAVFDTPRPPVPYPLYTRQRGYIAPKKDGYTLAGSTVERVGFNTNATDETRRDLASRAIQLVPLLAKAPLRALAIAGLRPGTPDDLPFLGRFPEFENLVIASGHFRNGILLAPVTGRIVNEFINGQKPSIDLTPFRPDRFSPVARS